MYTNSLLQIIICPSPPPRTELFRLPPSTLQYHFGRSSARQGPAENVEHDALAAGRAGVEKHKQ